MEKTFNGQKVGDYRSILLEKFEERHRKNPRYSQRAFARDLGIRSNRLSEILSGKQGISQFWASRIAERLGLDYDQREYFCNLVLSRHARSQAARTTANQKLRRLKANVRYRKLPLDSFKIISDWYHFAILELIKTADFVPDEDWIARRLNITTEIVKEAVARLEEAGLLEKGKKTWSATADNNMVPGKVPSDCIKQFHSSLLKKAQQALYSQTLQEREFSSVILAVDKKRMEAAKERLRTFWKEFDLEFGSTTSKGETKTDVYCLALQFYKLTDEKGKEDA